MIPILWWKKTKLKLHKTGLMSHNCESVSWWRAHSMLLCCLSALAFWEFAGLWMYFWCVLNRTFARSILPLKLVIKGCGFYSTFLTHYIKSIPSQLSHELRRLTQSNSYFKARNSTKSSKPSHICWNWMIIKFQVKLCQK